MSDDRNRKYGILGTLLFHGLLFLVLFFMALRTPLPLPGEEGMEVNLGFSEQGMGDVQPVSLPAGQQTVSAPTAAQKDDELVTEDNEESVALREKPKPKPTEKVTQPVNKPVETKPAEPVVNPNALYKGKPQDQGATANQGIAGGTGDQGRPDGSPGSQNYSGQGGSGDGPGFWLEGRKKVYLFPAAYNSAEQGRVVVEIVVDREGNVIRAIAGRKVPNSNIGTTTTDQVLWKAAREAALRSKFTPNPNADSEQKGYIAYNFVRLD